MNKVLRFVLSSCTACCLFALLLVPTCAAEVTWTEGGYSRTASVVKDDDHYIIPVPIESASVIDHVAGEVEVITWPLGYVATRSCGYNGYPLPTDLVYIKQAASSEGVPLVPMSCQLSDPDRDFYILSAELPSGTYSYGAEFTVYDATWTVTSSQSAGRAMTDPTSGTLIGIPVSCTDSKMIVIELD